MPHLPRHLYLVGAVGAVAVVVAAIFTWWLITERHQREVARKTVISGKPQALPDNAANVTVPWDKVIEELRFPESSGSVAPILLDTPPSLTPTPQQTDTLGERPTPRWMTNAAPPPTLPAGAKRVAIVLDDMGVNIDQTEKALTLMPAEVTFAFLPYGRGTPSQAKRARDKGHEIMVHMPMEPMPRSGDEHGTSQIDPGPNALYANLDSAEIIRLTELNLKKLLPLSVGVNNHMGSRFTATKEAMRPVLEVTDSHGLFFMDSVTTGSSQVRAAAAGLTLPVLERDVFIDHYHDRPSLDKALAQVARHAQTHGRAIAIGHPHQSTLDALKDWIPTLAEKNIYLVPVTDLIRMERAPAQ
jgi:polysaccharide deacetylase 2 family uncharacterized protein YibQ